MNPPFVHIEADSLLGHKTRVTDVETGLNISNRITGIDIVMRAGHVTRVTLHTIGTLDVLAEVERIIEPCEHCRIEDKS